MSGIDVLDPILTVRETASYLKISKSKLYAMIQRKEIPYLRMGKSVRIRLKDLIEWMDNRVDNESDGLT